MISTAVSRLEKLASSHGRPVQPNVFANPLLPWRPLWAVLLHVKGVECLSNDTRCGTKEPLKPAASWVRPIACGDSLARTLFMVTSADNIEEDAFHRLKLYVYTYNRKHSTGTSILIYRKLFTCMILKKLRYWFAAKKYALHWSSVRNAWLQEF